MYSESAPQIEKYATNTATNSNIQLCALKHSLRLRENEKPVWMRYLQKPHAILASDPILVNQVYALLDHFILIVGFLYQTNH